MVGINLIFVLPDLKMKQANINLNGMILCFNGNINQNIHLENFRCNQSTL